MKNSKIDIREFDVTDAEPVAHCIERALAPFRNSFDHWEETLNEFQNIVADTVTSVVWVAEYDSKVVGVARQSPKTHFFGDRSRARLLIGDPDYVNFEVERALIQVCLWRARKCGASELALSIHPECTAAISSALKIGFEKESHRSRTEMPFDRYVISIRY